MNADCIGFLLKVESQCNHLGMGLFDRVGVHQHTLVSEVLGMIGVQTVPNSVHKLEFWSEFEVGKVEVAAYSSLKIRITAF